MYFFPILSSCHIYILTWNYFNVYNYILLLFLSASPSLVCLSSPMCLRKCSKSPLVHRTHFSGKRPIKQEGISGRCLWPLAKGREPWKAFQGSLPEAAPALVLGSALPRAALGLLWQWTTAVLAAVFMPKLFSVGVVRSLLAKIIHFKTRTRPSFHLMACTDNSKNTLYPKPCTVRTGCHGTSKDNWDHRPMQLAGFLLRAYYTSCQGLCKG